MSTESKYVPTKLTRENLSALLAIRGELPAKLYLLLASLGAHMGNGWYGSNHVLTQRFNALCGRHVGQSIVGDGVAKLVQAGLLETLDADKNRRRYRLTSPETGEDEARTSPETGEVHNQTSPETGEDEARTSPETGEVPHRKPVRSITQEKEERIGERGDARAAAPDVCIEPIRVNAAQWTADGLAGEIEAADRRLRFSPEQIDDLVRDSRSASCSGSDSIRQQIAWWPLRDNEWIAKKGYNAKAIFKRYCTEHEPAPAPKPKEPTRPCSQSIEEAMPELLRTKRTTLADYAREHPEIAAMAPTAKGRTP